MSEQQIIQELRRLECELSPENLTWDGERPHKDVMAAEKRLLKQRAALVQELGREPTDKELYG